MKFTPLFKPTTTDAKPRAQMHSGSIGFSNTLRNNFTITTWLLIGGALQALLVVLPIRRLYAIAPVFLLLAYRVSSDLLMVFGLKENAYMKDVIVGKHSALYPGSDGAFTRSGHGGPGGDEITVVHLGARCNHPLGLFAPGFRQAFDFITAMGADLESHAEEYGWLGGTQWLNAGDRAATTEIMQVHYFRSREGLAKFSHGKAHREGWDWFNAFAKKERYLAFNHEVYSAPAGRWENIFLHSAPAGVGTTTFPVRGEEGERRWVSPIVEASRGNMRSSAGRMGMDDGAGNEKYGAEPYQEAVV